MQQLYIESDNIDKIYKPDIDNFVDTELGVLSIVPVQAEEAEEDIIIKSILKDRYLEDLQKIAKYLTILRRPDRIGKTEFRVFKKQVLQYTVIDRKLYRIRSKNIPNCIVIDLPEKQLQILKSLYNKSGYKEKESTYRKVADRYYWEIYYQDTKTFVASCKKYQYQDLRRLEETLYPIWTSTIFEKIYLNIVYIPSYSRKDFLVIVRKDFSR